MASDRAFIFHIHVCSLWQDLSIGTEIFDLVTLTLKFDPLFKNFNIGHIFWMASDRAFIFHIHVCSLWQDLSIGIKNFDLVTLKFDPLFKNFSIVHIFWMVSDRVDWLFTVLRPAQEFFTYMEMSPLPVKGCKILAYARRSGLLSREGSLSCHTRCDTGPRFLWSYPKDRPIQSPLMTHEGMWRIYSNPGSLWQELSNGTIIFDPVTLKFEPLFKNFNCGRIFWIVSDRAFVFHMHVT
jgi:hypothetical protein